MWNVRLIVRPRRAPETYVTIMYVRKAFAFLDKQRLYGLRRICTPRTPLPLLQIVPFAVLTTLKAYLTNATRAAIRASDRQWQ